MPIVPKYENNVPGVVESGRGFGAPVDNVRPSFDYENVMNRALQPWSQLADSTIKIEAYHHDTVVKAQADEQLDAYNKEVQTTLYDPDKGYFAQRGKNAVTGWDQAQTDLQSIYDKHLSQIDDPDVKEAFKSNALQRLNSVRQKTVVYRNEQNIRWRAQTSKDHADNLVEEFALGGFTPDGQRTMASLMNEIDYQGRMEGWDEETLKRQKNAYKSLAYAGAYSNASMADPLGAFRHFQVDGSKQMSADVGRRTYQMLFQRSALQLVQIMRRLNGPTAVALTSGATARVFGNTDPNVLRQSAAQAGIGTPPKVSDKVLNTSGYKGCNPLNVKVFGNKWKGLIGQDERGHAIFARPEDGIRAGVKVIQTYAHKYGLNTIESILSRFAAADSLTMGAYVDNVSHATGYKSNERLNLKDPDVLKKVVTAMMKQEIGDVPYSERTIIAGIQGALGKEDINDFSDFYNTKLTDEEEAQYQAWAKKIGHERDVYDYDLRGAWKAGAAQAENGHFPDTFKKPNHHTFSEESQYADGKRNIGGRWVVENGQNIFIGPNGERRDDNGKLLSEGTDQAPRLTAADLAFNPKVKTGIEVFDALNDPEKIWIMQHAKQAMGQDLKQQRIELKKNVDNALSLALTQGDISTLPDISDFIGVYGQDDGVRMHQEAAKQAQLNSYMYQMPGMSLAEITSISKSLMPQKDDPEYANRIEQKATWDKAAQTVLKKRDSDPMSFAINHVPAHGLTTIEDFNQPLAKTLNEVSNRVSQFESIGQSFAIAPQSMKLFTNEEAARLNDTLEKMNADQAAPIVSAISGLVEEQGGAAASRTLINQFTKDGRPTKLSSALALATSANAVNKGYVKEYLAGNAFLTNKEADPDTSKSAVNEEIGKEIRGLFGQPEAGRQAVELIRGIYANRQTMDSDRKSIEEIVEDVYGRNEEFNGARVFMPRNTNASMRTLVAVFSRQNANDKTSVQFRGGKTTLGELTEILPKAQLECVDDGKYLIRDGTDYVRYSANQAPVILDFGKAIDAANKDLDVILDAALKTSNLEDDQDNDYE